MPHYLGAATMHCRTHAHSTVRFVTACWLVTSASLLRWARPQPATRSLGGLLAARLSGEILFAFNALVDFFRKRPDAFSFFVFLEQRDTQGRNDRWKANVADY